MYSLTPRINPYESSSGSSTPRIDMRPLPAGSEPKSHNSAPVSSSMSTVMARSKSSTNMIGKFFTLSKSSKPLHRDDHAVELYQRSWPEFKHPPTSIDDAIINPVIRPMGQKLVARMEPRLSRGGSRKAFRAHPPVPAPLLRPSLGASLLSPETFNDLQRRGYLSNVYPKPRETSNPRPRETSYRKPREASNRGTFEARTRTSAPSSASRSARRGVMNIPHTQRILFGRDNQIESVARLWSSGNEEEYSWWTWYLESYTKGQFNLADIPPLRHKLAPGNYFPALSPPWELEILSETRKLEVIWPEWTEERSLPTEGLLASASELFKPCFIALSFFDEKYEIIQVETGYGVKYIPRDCSLAAHALLSKDILTILDTKETVHFENHPLVLNEPRIRFFAAAPLLSSRGIPIGVFSIWSPTPRETFTHSNKLDLVTYASIMLRDLEAIADDLPGSDGRSTPLLLRDSVINGDYQASSPASTDPRQSGTSQSHSLCLYTDETPLLQSPSTFSTLKPDHGLLCEQTPPSSAEPGQGPSFSNLQQGFGKNFKQLSVNPELSTYPQLQDMITPESPDFDISRPFSGSDLTSIHREPNNTPHNTPGGGEVADFLALSDRDVYEDFDYSEDYYNVSGLTGTDQSHIFDDSVQFSDTKSFTDSLHFTTTPDLSLTAHNLAKIPSCPLIDLSTPPRSLEKQLEQSRGDPHGLGEISPTPQSPYARYSKRSSRVHESKQSYDSREVPSLSCTEASNQLHDMVAEQPPGLSFTQSTVSSSYKSSDARATSTLDLDAVIEQHALQLGYDKMYAVEMIPARPDITDEELYEYGGINYTVLASYGPASLDARGLNHIFHVDCLRSTEYYFYACEESSLTGILFSYATDETPAESRTRGIVFGAYKNNVEPMDANVELSKLQEVLNSLLAAIKPLDGAVLKPSKTEPVSPKPFLASEAREIDVCSHEHQSLDHELDHRMSRLHIQNPYAESDPDEQSPQQTNWSQDPNGDDHIEDYTLAVNYFGHAYLKKKDDNHSPTGSNESPSSEHPAHGQSISLQSKPPGDARDAISRMRQHRSGS